MADQAPSPQAQAPLPSSEPAQPAQPAQAQPDPSPHSEPEGHAYRDEVAEAVAAAKEAFPDQDTDSDNSAGQEAVAQQPSTSGDGTEKGPSSDKRPDTQTEEVTAPSPAPTDKVKPSALATFHRQQKELFARERALKQTEAESAKIKSALANAKDDPLAALEVMGYTDVKGFLEKLAEDGGRLTPERQKLKELEKWREEELTRREAEQKQHQERQQQAVFQSKLDSLRQNIQTQIKSETYAGRLINLPGADEQVMVQMDKMASETGEMPRVEDAIQAVEGRFRTYLEDMAKNPEIVEYFRQRVGAGKSSLGANSQSKGREKPQTIGANARSPGLTPTPKRKANRYGDDDEVAEAIEWLNQSR